MAVKTRLVVEKEIGYVSQFAMNLTGYIHLKWEWQSDDDVIIFNAEDSEGSPADDNKECADMVAKLTGWETYPITVAEEYDQFSREPFKVGLRKPKD